MNTLSSAARAINSQARPHMNPYLAGVGIGLVLLAAFVIYGRGLGATGAYSAVLATTVAMTAPEHVADNLPYKAFLDPEQPSLLNDWLVVEILGVLIGGSLSALWARRFRIKIDRGRHTTDTQRLLLAILGGVLMGVGAKLARGCTSGQGLTGGALFSVGSWLFIAAAFTMAYLLAPLLRRQWS